MSSKHTMRPNVLPWPPMLLAGAAVASILLGGALPLPALHETWTVWLGGAVVLIGIALDVWAIVTMRRADTNILPTRAADLLVTWGPFRYSRNPIYLANTILLIGIGIAVGNYWFILCALASALLVDRLAIRREEHHLAARFGADWIDYSQQTPRWLF